MRMMIVVKLFAADQYAPRDDVAACVIAEEIAVAPIVPESIDDARRRDRDPYHLHGPDREAYRPK